MQIQHQNIRDKIPRVHQILPHMRAQLKGFGAGTTFEEARQRYARTVDRLVSQGLGRSTASRVGGGDQYWASTRDLLDEAMRLGFVEQQPLPSSRRYLDSHRDRVHELTTLGYEAAEEAKTDLRSFYDRLSATLYSKHPYFRAFINCLHNGPIGFPEVTEGEVALARRSGLGKDYWVQLAHDRSASLIDSTRLSFHIQESINSVIRHRFGQPQKKNPTNKQVAEALNDAYIEATLRVHGLRNGAIDLKTMKKWGSQLLILDQSRYVPTHAGQNVIWLAANIHENGDTVLKRKTFYDNEQELVDAVVDSYKQQAQTVKSSLDAPYLPIYRVRAQAALRCKVTRALVDIAIERMTLNAVSRLPVQVFLHLGVTRQPESEPLYRRGGNRRYEITMETRSIEEEELHV